MSEKFLDKVEILKDNKSIFLLDASNNALVLRNKGSKDNVWIHADSANGGSGIDLRDKNGSTKIVLNGESGDISFNNATCAGDINLSNADFAEDFDILEIQTVEPGTVMVIDSEGKLRESNAAYDKKVVGVIAGAGNFKPGIVMDRQPSQNDRMPISLMGKVFCKVDAQYASIEVGDLLTTSPTPGHAMKASDPLMAFGSVIGKALRPLQKGQGLIPILIALQ
jgi:hypothetical protein